MSDLINRIEAVEHFQRLKEASETSGRYNEGFVDGLDFCISFISTLPSAEPEPLTDKEQRIFLAAMGREEKVCEEVDRNYAQEPYEDSLMRVCKEITRKVKKVLWK